MSGWASWPVAARLARESGLEYAAACPVANRAAGLESDQLDLTGIKVVLERPIAVVEAAVADLL